MEPIYPKSPKDILDEGLLVLYDSLVLEDAAVIFDLDHTLLYLSETANVVPIIEMIELWNTAAFLGYSCYIVTARTCWITTMQDLREVTSAHPTQIFARRGENTNPWRSKAEARDIIYSRHPVVLNIGDSLWDVGRVEGASSKFRRGVIPDAEPVMSALISVTDYQ